jgi:hypothetical protein
MPPQYFGNKFLKNLHTLIKSPNNVHYKHPKVYC